METLLFIGFPHDFSQVIEQNNSSSLCPSFETMEKAVESLKDDDEDAFINVDLIVINCEEKPAIEVMKYLREQLPATKDIKKIIITKENPFTVEILEFNIIKRLDPTLGFEILSKEIVNSL